MIIDVYADIVCPWCYIGVRRWQQAIAQRPDLQIERRWQPFQLQPDLPATGKPWQSFVNTKFGGTAAFDQVARIGAGDGLQFRFDRIASAPNTVDAHRLVLYASQHDRQWPMVNALFAGYFSEGRDLNDLEQLIELAAGVGLNADEVRAYLNTDAGRATVEVSQMQAYQRGVNSVPHYIIDGRYALVGAQPVDVLLQALDYVEAARTSENRGIPIV